MERKKTIKVGIGFATGRKGFQKVLRSYIHNWKESGLVGNSDYSLNIIVAYDLNYKKTLKTDYIGIHPELANYIDSSTYIGKSEMNREVQFLTDENIITPTEAAKIFGKGYASQRNAVMYSAAKNNIDYLIFLDDDEYPVAVTNTKKTAVWGGQHVLSTHIRHLQDADLTHGHHCGYISPIPYIDYNDVMPETMFRTFIEAISNDILSWDKIKTIMDQGGVTYADTSILISDQTREVGQVNHAKFISGANLGINLTDLRKVFPFYNPPGARGEDTFLSTCLHDRKVLKVPCYTFHDGFSTYNHLLEGVLPTQLKFIKAENQQIVDRFYAACIGWIRYKPLLIYIQKPGSYEQAIEEIRQKLDQVLPSICSYFNRPDFMNLVTELNTYDKNVKKHAAEFAETQRIWAKIMDYLANRND